MMRYVFSIIGLFLAGGIFFWYTKPTYDSVQGVRAESAQYDAALAKAAELQQLKQTLLTRYNSFNPTDLDRVEKLLPDHVDNVALILDLDNLAAKFQMPIENVDVSTPASSASNQTGIATIGGNGQKYDSVTIRFSTRGTYTDFMAFLKQLEASLRVVDLVSLSLIPDASADNLSTGEPGYSYEMTLRTYWLK
jgi:Tfp pilus assembly protein PilO